MDGEARTASRWPLVFGGVVAFGLLVTASGLVLASVPVTVQGVCLTVAGLIGLVLTGLRGVPVRGRLPYPVPWTLTAGALVLVATAVESARSSPSPWAPLGLLVGVALLGIPVRALPPAPRPRATVALVLVGLVLMVGYEVLQHLLSPEPGDLPSYLAAVGMPLAAAVAAGALAVLAATRGPAARAAAAGGLVLVSAGLFLAEAAGNHWWLRQTLPGYPTGNTGVAFIAVQTSSAYESSASFSFGPPTDVTTVLLVLGLALTVAGWWWAAVRRRAG
ncbi:hypothetical protein [Virgisporangium ochraceum]|uniref:hypothetical protein n=1 Tax=Virgisporangium ochraceum TaxID=65505 RepID=UPI001940F333|nr:hypothetical protein [Virgisporangium ochraceum]